jgi:hypothetical protein
MNINQCLPQSYPDANPFPMQRTRHAGDEPAACKPRMVRFTRACCRFSPSDPVRADTDIRETVYIILYDLVSLPSVCARHHQPQQIQYCDVTDFRTVVSPAIPTPASHRSRDPRGGRPVWEPRGPCHDPGRADGEMGPPTILRCWSVSPSGEPRCRVGMGNTDGSRPV